MLLLCFRRLDLVPVKICNGRRLGRRPPHGPSQCLAKQPRPGRKAEWHIEGIWALDPESEKVSRKARTEQYMETGACRKSCD